MAHQRKQHLIWLIAILCLAMLVRFNGMLSQSLWIDEGFTWNLTQYGDMFAILSRDVHPPLYFIMMDMWVDLAGTSVFSMRYFSLLPSLLSVVVLYQLAREILTQRGQSILWIPLIAAAVMAVAEAETFLSQEARSYTWHVLYASLSMLGFLRWQRTDKRHYAFLWMLATIALIYTFYLGAFVGVVQGIYSLLFLRKRQRIIAIVMLIICAMTLMPWLLLTGAEQTENISSAEWIKFDAFGFWLDDFRTKYFTGLWLLTGTLVIAGFFTVQSKRIRLHRTGILLLMWFGIPLLLTLLLNSQVPTYQPRRVSQIVPAITLLMALGIGHLSPRWRWLLVSIIMLYGAFNVDFWRYKQPWQQMVDETVPYISDSTPILFELGGDDYAPRYHYGQSLPDSFDFLLDEGIPSDNGNVLFGLTTWRDLRPEEYSGSLPAIINSVDHWWFFYWSSDTGALDWLANFGFQRTATLTVDFNPDVYLYRYDRVPEAPIITYDNGLQLRDAILHDDLTVELLWSTNRPLDLDYIVAVSLVDAAGEVIAQEAGVLFVGKSRTSTWEVNELIYDHNRLTPIVALDEASYAVNLVVYSQNNGEFTRIPTENMDLSIRLGEINLNND